MTTALVAVAMCVVYLAGLGSGYKVVKWALEYRRACQFRNEYRRWMNEGLL